MDTRVVKVLILIFVLFLLLPFFKMFLFKFLMGGMGCWCRCARW